MREKPIPYAKKLRVNSIYDLRHVAVIRNKLTFRDCTPSKSISRSVNGGLPFISTQESDVMTYPNT
ncbi:hypothetical protein M413DRAFT_443504 [Hebeloma cylindrosporum]|uniref:Uncharacterized protein n=1 Tax=Hebeloma cylindrosporum TaxID=76867 RepID=A0A0C3C3X6_HEBCY|nr:hypothetical protein M413DRAFT_443504 [Hebeloma cylindrosporum h7]